MKRIILGLLIGSLVLVNITTAGAMERSPHLRLANGILISPDYHDFMEKMYPDYSVIGGYGFLNVQASVQFFVAPQLDLFVNVDGFFNYFSGDLNFVNIMVAPSVSARFAFTPVGGSPYIRVDLNRNSPYTGSDRMEWDSDGFGFNFLGGYRMDDGGEFEVGYMILPVKVNLFAEENFGGFILRFRYEM